MKHKVRTSPRLVDFQNHGGHRVELVLPPYRKVPCRCGRKKRGQPNCPIEEHRRAAEAQLGLFDK